MFDDLAAGEAAKQLGSEAAKSVMGNTESILAPMAGEESSSLRTVVSIRNAGAGENQNEIIQSNPSSEFLNSLPFIKKFYPTPRWGEGKVTEVALDNNFDSPETVHSPLTTHHSLKHAAFTLPEGATHVAHCDKFCRAAFTLAEVLITLGIIGVVAALTLPTLIQNHQKQVYVTQLKKAYSNINNAFNKMAVDEGVVDWNQTYCGSLSRWGYIVDEATKANNNECLDRIAKQMKVINRKDFGVECSTDWCKYGDSNVIYYSYSAAGGMFTTPDGALYMFACGFNAYVDINGAAKGPNKDGRDVFAFYIDPTNNKIVPDGSYYDRWKNCSATNLSTYCTAKVLIEGKMNY